MAHELIERASQAVWEERRKTAFGVQYELPPWELETDALRDSVRNEVKVMLRAMRDIPEDLEHAAWDQAQEATQGVSPSSAWRAITDLVLM